MHDLIESQISSCDQESALTRDIRKFKGNDQVKAIVINAQIDLKARKSQLPNSSSRNFNSFPETTQNTNNKPSTEEEDEQDACLDVDS